MFDILTLQMNSYSSLFIELANPIRLTLLDLLSKNSYSLSELAQKIDVSKPEVLRHVTRLTNQHIISKYNNQLYQLSNLGTIIITLLEPLEFLLKQVDYFKDHLIDLPNHLIHKLQLLTNAELIRGFGEAMVKIDQIANLPENKNSYILVHQRFPSIRKQQKAQNAYIIIPETMKENRPFTETKKIYEILHIKTLKVVSFGIWYIEDSMAFLCFPDKNNIPDYSEGFFITDEFGLTFVKELWNYFWSEAYTLGTF